MSRADKSAAVAELADEFRRSSAAVLTEYRGLTVAQLKTLRRSLGVDTTYAVVKNTLTKIAAREAGVSAFDDLLQGPSAIAFVKGDPVEAARGLRDFAKAHPLLVIKGGVLDGRAVSPAELSKIADLESREVLLANLAGAMSASLQNAVSLFAAPLAQTARLIESLRAKAEQDPTILTGSQDPQSTHDTHGPHGPAGTAAVEPAQPEESAVDTPAVDAPAVDAPAVDAPAEAQGPTEV